MCSTPSSMLTMSMALKLPEQHGGLVAVSGEEELAAVPQPADRRALTPDAHLGAEGIVFRPAVGVSGRGGKAGEMR